MPQHKLPNKHGGHRQNSGRHKNSETLGCPVRFRGLQQFGFTRNDITARTTSTLGTPPVAMMAVADGDNSQGPTKHQERQAMLNSMSTTKKNATLVSPSHQLLLHGWSNNKMYNWTPLMSCQFGITTSQSPTISAVDYYTSCF
jgi:hypothetical protein